MYAEGRRLVLTAWLALGFASCVTCARAAEVAFEFDGFLQRELAKETDEAPQSVEPDEFQWMIELTEQLMTCGPGARCRDLGVIIVEESKDDVLEYVPPEDYEWAFELTRERLFPKHRIPEHYIFTVPFNR